MRKHVPLIATCFASLSLGGIAHAQQNNRPFNFPSAGGMGISSAGKQAILNQQLTGVAPDNLARDSDGVLVEVERGPGGIPISKSSGGSAVAVLAPRKRPPWSNGVDQFNSFFVKFDGLAFRSEIGTTSGQMVDSWTGSVYGLITVGGNSVDQWTGMVYP